MLISDTLGAFACNSAGRLEEPRYEGDHSADKRNRTEQEYAIIFFSRSHAMETPHCSFRSDERRNRVRAARESMRIVVVGMLIAVIPLQAFAAASKKPVATKQSIDASTTKSRSV
ncbi:hypothetical protein [Bradyrhizobium sp. NFR13]|uniref:hypothetical protein n=1 Tax=Bradyrhizobium sp. NFR13 TaxID=1566285 RepID=UPI000B80AA9A|nr:hypothetical protein [Bradyrhizobium sp. NFR13]